MIFQLPVTQTKRFQPEFVKLQGKKPTILSGNGGDLAPLHHAVAVQESNGDKE